MKHKLSKKQEGFTIIELLIATSVLAVILVIVTLILISISGLYDKGVHLSTIQDNTRDTIEEIGQDIQLTNGTFTIGSDSGQISGFPAGAHSQAFCIGDTRYTYVLGYAEGTGYESTSDTPLINHVLWRDNQAQDPNSCQALSLNQSNPDTSDTIPGNSTNGVELVAPGTRLTNLSVIQNPNGAYVIEISEAFGTEDQINTTTAPASLTNPLCITQTGDQFCATDSLTLDVTPRVANSGS